MWTSKSPFPTFSSDFALVIAILNGANPDRPLHADFSDALWALVQRCWKRVPAERPSMAEIAEFFTPVEVAGFTNEPELLLTGTISSSRDRVFCLEITVNTRCSDFSSVITS